MNLHLNLKFEYFDAIREGRKPFEYRIDNEYWRKRLIGRKYDNNGRKLSISDGVDAGFVLELARGLAA